MSKQKKTESQFCDYETAKMLKELGFKEICYGFFAYLEKHDIWIVMDLIKSENKGGVVSAPMWQKIEEWLWEKRIHVNISCRKGVVNKPRDFTVCSLDMDKKEIVAVVSRAFDSPITAKIEGIKQVIKHLHSKK